LVKNRDFFHNQLAFDAITFGTEKLEWCGYPTVKKFDEMFSRFDTTPACEIVTANFYYIILGFRKYIILQILIF